MTKLYKDLGVSESAKPEEIKRAYRSRAKHMHPDAGGNREQFDKLNHAYLILKDPVRRLKYDTEGLENISPDNTQSDAINLFHRSVDELIESVLASDQDINKFDFIFQLRTNYDQNIQKLKTEIQGQKYIQKKLLEASKKFLVKNGENVMRNIIDTKIVRTSATISMIEKHLSTLQLALKLLDNYDFQFDKTNDVYFSFTGSSTS